MAKFINKTLTRLATIRKIGEALKERCSHELSNLLFPELDFEEQRWPHLASTYCLHTPTPVVEVEEQEEPTPIEEPVTESLSSDVVEEEEWDDDPEPAQPSLGNVEKHEFVATELVLKRETFEKSRFVCGYCLQNHRGDYMKSALFDNRGYIPSLEEIIAKALCKFCTPADQKSSWLPGVIRHAEKKRQDRVKFVIKMMHNTLHGDPEKPEHIVAFHLRKSQVERAEKAMSYYLDKIQNDSSQSLFEANDVAMELLETARQWILKEREAKAEAEIMRLAKKIRGRIERGNLKKARNTLESLRNQVGSCHTLTQLEAMLLEAESKKEQQEDIANLRTKIVNAIESNDDDLLVAHIAYATDKYPEINWDEFADEALAQSPAAS